MPLIGQWIQLWGCAEDRDHFNALYRQFSFEIDISLKSFKDEPMAKELAKMF